MVLILEFLAQQKAVGERKETTVEIPYAFLAEEEICSRYVANVFSKAKINGWIKKSWTENHIVPKISRDAISVSRRLCERGIKGFLVTVDVDIVKETWLNKNLNPEEYDSKGHLLIPAEHSLINEAKM